MALPNDIVLRPRFEIELPESNQHILTHFETLKTTQSQFILHRIDDHVFIKFPKVKQHFWSPQLHLRVNEVDKNNCIIHGLFGPSSTVWTLFMFLHFLVAVLCIGFGVWAYTNWRLDNNFSIQLLVVALMLITWVVLYLAGRMGKATGHDQTEQLFKFLKDAINR